MASLRSQQDLHTINSDNPKSSTVPIGFMKYNNYRGKKQIRTGARASHSSCGYGVFVVIALCLVSFTVIGGNYLFSFLRNHKGQIMHFESKFLCVHVFICMGFWLKLYCLYIFMNMIKLKFRVEMFYQHY